MFEPQWGSMASTAHSRDAPEFNLRGFVAHGPDLHLIALTADERERNSLNCGRCTGNGQRLNIHPANPACMAGTSRVFIADSRRKTRREWGPFTCMQ